MKTLNLFILSCCLFFLSGCATLVNGKYQDVSVNSNPQGATVTVEPGDYAAATTPTVLSLKRADGPYRITITLDGYKPYIAYLKASDSGWQWGNVIAGGIIGIIVDHSTGAATKLDTNEVMAELIKLDVRLRESENQIYVFNPQGNLLASLNLE